MIAANGNPSAPPTPSDALINPIAVPTRWAGTHVRSTLIPSGTMGTPKPCSARPMTTGTHALVDAAIREPTVIRIAQAISRRLGPYMSPSLPTTGVATAATSSVAVITHDALDALVLSSFGSSGISGITNVCINDMQVPVVASTATTTAG